MQLKPLSPRKLQGWIVYQLRYTNPFVMYSEDRYYHVLYTPIKIVDYQILNKKVGFHYY